MLDEAVRAFAGTLGEPDGPPVPLEGGFTNRNYRVRWAGRECVLRLPGKDTGLLGIDRAAERTATDAAAAAGVGPEVVAFDGALGCLVTRFIEGRGVTAEELRERADEAGAALRAIHAGPALPSAFSALDVVQAYRRTALAHGAPVPEAYDRLLAGARAIAVALTGPEHAPVPCHNDLLTANFLDDGGRLRIVDWEYAGMGDRYFDLGNLSVGNGFAEGDDERLLAAYWGEPSTPRRLAAVRLMRVLSDFREAMWGVLQAGISELDFDFGAYGAEHLDRVAAGLADPRLEGWLEAARAG
jgi:thiamine kinase-like enzyme